jgi:hypothetical protein
MLGAFGLLVGGWAWGWKVDAKIAETLPMSDKNRFKFKIPFVAEGEAEGLIGIAAFVVVLVVLVVAIAVH